MPKRAHAVIKDEEHEEQEDEQPGHSTFEPALFEKLVYTAVKCIPKGKVTTYGHIASLCHHPKHARHVGKALGRLSENTRVPWQRVINASFTISPRGDGGVGSRAQADKLREEGIQSTQDAMGVWKVSRQYQWETKAKHLDEVLKRRGRRGGGQQEEEDEQIPQGAAGEEGGGGGGLQVKEEEEEEDAPQ